MITAMPRIAIAVRDFEAAVSTFRDGFGMPVVDMSESTVDELGAHLGMCVPEGGSNIEIMSPASPDMALSQALTRFLDRRGDGLYALMLEAPEPDVEAEELMERGVNVLPLMKGASGRDVHPSSTHGVLIRVYPNDSVRLEGSHDGVEPGLSGISRVIIATTDASSAALAYGPDGLGLDVGPAVEDEERGVLGVLCTPPKGGLIELVSVLNGDRPFAGDIENFLSEKKEGMYALVLQTEDADGAASTLIERDVSMGGSTGLEASVFGARFLLE